MSRLIGFAVIVLLISGMTHAMFKGDYKAGPEIMPEPASIKHGQEKITFNGCNIKWKHNVNMISDIVEVYQEQILGKAAFLHCKATAHSAHQTQNQGEPFLIDIVLADTSGEYYPDGHAKENEKYSLTVNGRMAKIRAPFYPGVVRALESLTQLIEMTDKKQHTYLIEYAPIEIDDIPRLPYRGVMVDTAREFMPIRVLKQVVDGLMMAKMNHLHWHFFEDDSIPMFSKHFPDLVNYTAFSKEEVYMPD